VAPFGHGHGEFLLYPCAEKREAFGSALAADVSELFENYRPKLKPMPIRVDDRVTQATTYLCSGIMPVVTHE
jgi:hypothetical protein